MPTMSNSQSRLPSVFPQMEDWMGTLSPIFQWNRSAVLRPTMAPVRVSSHACFCSGARTNSGNMSRNSSGTTGIWGKKLLASW